MEPLESSVVRPRQARYQAALRPDMKCVMIIRHPQTRVLLQQAHLAFNCAKITSLSHYCARVQTWNQWHFVGLPINLAQSFSLHLQLRLRISLEDLRATLTKQLHNPLVGHAACAETGSVRGSKM